MSVVMAIVVAILAGIPVAMAVDRECDLVMLPALGFLYGTGLIYFVMLLMSLAHVAWSATRVTSVVAAIAIAAVMWSRASARPSFKFSVIDLLTIFTIIGYALYATVARVWQWDFWMIWGVKGATFFESRGIDWHFLESRFNDYTHPDYPLLLPCNYAYIGLLGGGWDDRWLGLVSVAYGVALIAIVRQMASREIAPIGAAAAAFAASAFALTAHVGMAESPMIAFGAAGVLQLRRGVAFGEHTALRHAGLLLGLAACSKNEGLALIVACAIALLLIKPRAIAALIPSVVLVLPWIILTRVHALPSDILSGFFQRALSRVDSIGTLGALLIRHLQDRLLWIAILAGLLIVPSALRRTERLVLIVTLIQILFFVIVYLGTPLGLQQHVATSWPRLPRQIGTPLVFVELLMLAKFASASEPLRTS